MESQKPSEKQSSQKTGVLIWSIATASFLFLLKFSAGFLSQSMAILASAVDSLMDVLVSVVNFFSLREAEKPADEDHAYGHGKIESLASLFQSVLIGLSGFYLVYESVRRLAQGKAVVLVDVAIVVMVISMVVTFLHVRQLRAVSKKTGSLIIGTEELHFLSDLWTNGGVIVALVLVRLTGSVFWDLVMAVLVSIYILKQSFGILKTSVDELIDRALPEEMQADIRNIILTYDHRIVGLHNLRTRRLGHKKFIEFHVEIDKTLTFIDAHDLTEALIEEVMRKIPDSDVNAHLDPEGSP